MSSKTRIDRKLGQLKADYASLGEGTFNHFLCPILLRDDDVELCMGHVISEKLPNCCRRTVVQRKDVDGFYGSLCESAFNTLVDIHRTTASGGSVLNDPGLRRALPFKVKLGEKAIECYEAGHHSHPLHPLVELCDRDATPFKLALKVSEADLAPAGNLQLTVERDFLPETVATLLKMAHLTQFVLFGYRYVFGAAGLMLAEILRTFFNENSRKHRDEQVAAAKSYFPNHTGMIMPAVGYDKNVIKGSIEDRRFLWCLGSSGAWYSLCVFVRVDDQMHLVLVPWDTAESAATYFELITDMHTKSFRFQLAELVPATEHEQAYWKVGCQEYTFRPLPDDYICVAKQ